ncbi:TIGR03086 family metal-binding protein [Streptomyces sp. NPDC059582]|uniref:TIGR03086 family metal-binding protein n=1 Tax=Streptomyces sp. NPDC059582 TaxID=3346875 RepID=UPI003697E428
MNDTMTFGLGPQARILTDLVAGVRDEQRADATPCENCAVRNLLGHLSGLVVAFRDAGRKDLGVTTGTSPDAAVPDIGPDWRQRLPEALAGLAEAWRDPAAWTGMTRAGGVDPPGAVAAAVLADELVVHGWDLARATGQEYAPTRPRWGRRTASSSTPPRTPTASTASSAPSSRCRTTPPCSTGRWDRADGTRAGSRRPPGTGSGPGPGNVLSGPCP